VKECADSYRTYPPDIEFALFLESGRAIHWARDNTSGYAVTSRVEGRLPQLFHDYDSLGPRATEQTTGRATIPIKLTDHDINRENYTGLDPETEKEMLAVNNRVPLDDQFTAGAKLHWLSSDQLLRAGQTVCTDPAMLRKHAICYVLSDRQFARFRNNPDARTQILSNGETIHRPPAERTYTWLFFIHRDTPPTDYPVDISSNQVHIEQMDDLDTATSTPLQISFDRYRRQLFEEPSDRDRLPTTAEATNQN
jgi:hypothetical protein